MQKLCINCASWEEVNQDKGVGVCLCRKDIQFGCKAGAGLSLTDWGATCEHWRNEKREK